MLILVVDDSRVMRQIVIRTLRQSGHGGHDIVEAENGREALELCTTRSVDLVLSDWNMPEMSGIDLLESLRERGSTVTFGFVTSEGSDLMRSRAQAAGAQFLIAKPFTPEAFDAALNAAKVG
ncbi:response regulator [Nocardioides sp. TRM66260-LWL]|uniref:response regulator n=1 Tax=Nocardioides sp. TRM66260-LWL TaxID=2874478 RepID=UPI001CC5003A|nr:response regulator [Nocardioides sp. TRM66260-LWL]MBZ5735172.1 response regulator [Nocardioides sp. TRM66260-LWL]